MGFRFGMKIRYLVVIAKHPPTVLKIERKKKYVKKARKLKFEVSKEELEQLVKTKPMTEIGKMFSVSDNAVKQRCKKLGIELKPMRGYWMKK